MTIARVGTDQTANASASPVSPSYPSGIAKGDLILITVAVNNTGTVTTPTGFTLMDTLTENVCVVRLYAKFADGTESGSLNIAFATSTNTVATIKARSGIFSSTLSSNFSTYQHDVVTGTPAAITTTALTNVPADAWLEAHCGASRNATTTATCTVTGTHWTERTDDVNNAGSNVTNLDTADNSTDTGTANAATFTFSAARVNIAAISFYIVEANILVGGSGSYIVTAGVPPPDAYQSGGAIGRGGFYVIESNTVSRSYQGGGGVYVLAGHSKLSTRILVGGVADLTLTLANNSLLRGLLLVGEVDALSFSVSAQLGRVLVPLVGETAAYTVNASDASLLKFSLLIGATAEYTESVVAALLALRILAAETPAYTVTFAESFSSLHHILVANTIAYLLSIRRGFFDRGVPGFEEMLRHGSDNEILEAMESVQSTAIQEALSALVAVQSTMRSPENSGQELLRTTDSSEQEENRAPTIKES